MKPRIAVLAVAGAMFGMRVATAGGLDAPIQPSRPTVRTEIYRGVSAQGDCGLDALRQLDCLFAIQGANVQRNTSTDAFNAGLFFGAWLSSVIDAEALRSATGKQEVTDAGRLYRSMKRYQAKLGLSDAELCEASRVKCANVMPMMLDWDQHVK